MFLQDFPGRHGVHADVAQQMQDLNPDLNVRIYFIDSGHEDGFLAKEVVREHGSLVCIVEVFVGVEGGGGVVLEVVVVVGGVVAGGRGGSREGGRLGTSLREGVGYLGGRGGLVVVVRFV